MTWAKTGNGQLSDINDGQLKVAVFASRPLICCACPNIQTTKNMTVKEINKRIRVNQNLLVNQDIRDWRERRRKAKGGQIPRAYTGKLFR